MRDYICRWKGQPNGIPVASLSSETIRGLLDYIAQGLAITTDDGEELEAVADRLRLELDIRAWGLNHDS
jgi:hypothetical protein